MAPVPDLALMPRVAFMLKDALLCSEFSLGFAFELDTLGVESGSGGGVVMMKALESYISHSGFS